MSWSFLNRDGGEPRPEQLLLEGLDLDERTVFDVGGFEGWHTLFFASRVGTSGRVVTFEPHPANRAIIARRLSEHGFGNVELRDYAAGSGTGVLEFAYPDDLGRGTADPRVKERILATEPARLESFPVRPLDAEIAAGRLPPHPDLVKLDVEGLEHEVLRGMEETVGRCAPALFVEVHAAGDPHERENYRRVAGWMLERDYGVTHVESGRQIRDPSDTEHCYAGQHLYGVARRR
jgi:FkbM family methyltransferase